MGRALLGGTCFSVVMLVANAAFAWHVEPEFIAFCHEEDAGGTCVDLDVDNTLIKREDLD
jgi:hypothetical protein